MIAPALAASVPSAQTQSAQHDRSPDLDLVIIAGQIPVCAQSAGAKPSSPQRATLSRVSRLAAIAITGIFIAALAGCGGSAKKTAESASGTAAVTKPVCPAAWRSGWQGVANEVRTGVYCPSWLPDPLDGRFDGPTFNGRFVNDKREYLVSFAWLESVAGGVDEVHVNLRGYPGRTAIPVCEDTLTVNGKTTHPKLPCFGDGSTRKRFGPTTVTVYTANQGVDQWHILYAWRHQGSLYTLSEHVASPYTRGEVVANLDRMMRGLVLLKPSS